MRLRNMLKMCLVFFGNLILSLSINIMLIKKYVSIFIPSPALRIYKRRVWSKVKQNWTKLEIMNAFCLKESENLIFTSYL